MSGESKTTLGLIFVRLYAHSCINDLSSVKQSNYLSGSKSTCLLCTSTELFLINLSISCSANSYSWSFVYFALVLSVLIMSSNWSISAYASSSSSSQSYKLFFSSTHAFWYFSISFLCFSCNSWMTCFCTSFCLSRNDSSGD